MSGNNTYTLAASARIPVYIHNVRKKSDVMKYGNEKAAIYFFKPFLLQTQSR